MEDDLQLLPEDKASADRGRLEIVKSSLNNLEIHLSMKCIYVVSKDLKAAILASQSNNFSLSELQVVEDAKFILDRSYELCESVLQPTREYLHDEEYAKAKTAALEKVYYHFYAV